MTSSPTRRRTGWLLLAAATLGSLLLGAPANAASGHHHVDISRYQYQPASMEVTEGDTVTWTNRDQVAHDVTVTSGPASFHSPMLAQGQSWSHTFTVAGSYSYICSVHPDMTARITVTAAPSSPAVVAPAPRASATEQATKPATKPATQPATTPAHQSATTPAPTKAGRPATGSPATQPTARTVTQEVKAPASAATLQPLLLVVGASVAAVVFCLLLMASRPVPAGAEDDTLVLRPIPQHREEVGASK